MPFAASKRIYLFFTTNPNSAVCGAGASYGKLIEEYWYSSYVSKRF